MATKPWSYHTHGDPAHIWPLEDLIEHDAADNDGGCACGPRIDPVKREDGSVGWIIVHHSLDGRENSE